jgi:hypothetical protein
LQDAVVDSLIDVARSPAADSLPGIWREVEERALDSVPCLMLARIPRIDGRGTRLAPFRANPRQPFGNLIELRLQSSGDQSAP